MGAPPPRDAMPTRPSATLDYGVIPGPPAPDWDSHPRDVCGRVTALTTLSAVTPRWARWLRLYFAVRRLAPRLGELLSRPLRELSFIHFGRWSLLPPSAGTESGGERRESAYLLFESNFNGRWDEYIDAFAYVLGQRMRLVWGGAYGFPGPRPAEPFKRYIRAHEYPASHYYAAHAETTATVVLAALELQDRFERFAHHTRRMSDEEFGQRFRDFHTEVQHLL